MDQMILKTQQWLNQTYGNKAGFGSVNENGKTGWPTIYALTRALQIELGITQTANNFGPSTERFFQNRWPNGIIPSEKEYNVHGIIQGALWCKGYAAEYGGITPKFTPNMEKSIVTLKSDMGISGNSSVDLDTMKCLLSMKQFKLLRAYGGKERIRVVQQRINQKYRDYTGIIPTDGLYSREMNTALIQVLQSLEGYTPSQATGHFGSGTQSKIKTITRENSVQNSEWVWLASTGLLCNGYDITPLLGWDNQLSSTLSLFQMSYCIPQVDMVDKTTWMSLLTSCGDPNRHCIACDTRFEITDELANYLKKDGYLIVGRYLSEPDQGNTTPEDYFKALRPGELQRIISHGLKYFPIFQEYSTKLEFFSEENGKRHAQEALAAAKRLGVPPTVIYFAVDYDATDPEVTSNILPYFKAVHDNLSDGYKVGIYASRNICARVAKAGYSVASFISDMSTGFSGNLGFSAPGNWVFDQFYEIKGYHNKWDLDRVAFSGRIGAVEYVLSADIETPVDTPYEIPPVPNTDSLTKLTSVFPMIQELEDAYSSWITNYFKYVQDPNYIPMSVPMGVLNYLFKTYTTTSTYKGYKSAILFAVAGAPYDVYFGTFVERTCPELTRKLDQFIGLNRESLADPIGGKNDLAHLAYTLYCYAYLNLSPEHWTGWAGDLASGMDDLHKCVQNHLVLNRQLLANALIGADPNNLSTYLLNNNVNNDEHFSIQCNYTDFCDDADAIRLASTLNAGDENIRTLSDAMAHYYNTLTPQIRYTAYMDDSLDYSTTQSLTDSIWKKMNGAMEHALLVGLLRHFAGESTYDERIACCQAMAHYLLAKSKQE